MSCFTGHPIRSSKFGGWCSADPRAGDGVDATPAAAASYGGAAVAVAVAGRAPPAPLLSGAAGDPGDGEGGEVEQLPEDGGPDPASPRRRPLVPHPPPLGGIEIHFSGADSRDAGGDVREILLWVLCGVSEPRVKVVVALVGKIETVARWKKGSNDYKEYVFFVLCRMRNLPTRRASRLARPDNGDGERGTFSPARLSCPSWRHVAACSVNLHIVFRSYGVMPNPDVPAYGHPRYMIEPRNTIRVPRIPPPQEDCLGPITVNGKTTVALWRKRAVKSARSI
ncbi:hypothetical protein NL676_006052 [Syzygium grande]|nr:hypothetical protein NL676_006052 [Syzygium grande]